MAKITIDNVDYDIDNLSELANQQLTMLKKTDQEIDQLNNQLAITQTARNIYANALKSCLPASENSVIIEK
jgi:hypothetical protein